MVPKLDFYIIDLGSFSKLHFDEVSLFQYAKVSEVVYIFYIYMGSSQAMYIQQHICKVYMGSPRAIEKTPYIYIIYTPLQIL